MLALGFWGLGCLRAWGLGLRGLGFGVWGLGLSNPPPPQVGNRIKDKSCWHSRLLGFQLSGFYLHVGFGVEGFHFRVRG